LQWKSIFTPSTQPQSLSECTSKTRTGTCRAKKKKGEHMSQFPNWTLKKSGTVMPDEKLPTGQTIILGLQHVVAMFGATALAPILMGFDPNVSIFFSGIATLIFFFITGGRLPSYLGSSFAFIAVVSAATGHAVAAGPNPNIGLALGGIIACGALYALIGVIVDRVGHAWVEKLMPPVVTGAIVAAIGLNLAPIAIKGISGGGLTTFIGLFTVIAVGIIATYTKGSLARLPILLGAALAYGLYMLLTNGAGMGKPIDFAGVANAAWFGMPNFSAPVFDSKAMFLIAPVAIILVAENLGHIKGIAAMTGRNLDPLIGKGFMADGVATMISGAGGGTGVTTYAENMGVMAVTRVFSTLVFVVAGLVAILLGFSPKFGALIQTIPGPVLGGLSVVVFGLITATAGRIWVESKVDFSNARNLLTVGTALVLGAGDFSVNIGGFTMGGIGTATFGAIILYHLMREPQVD
jgi:putative pyrimidine permease RutG